MFALKEPAPRTVEEDLAAVIDDRLTEHHLLPGAPALLRRIRELLLASRVGRRTAGESATEAVGLAQLAGVDGPTQEAMADEIARVLMSSTADELPADTVATLMQAYVRGVGRIAAAEADVLERALSAVEPEERADLLERLLRILLPAGERGFGLLREAMLHDELAYALGTGELDYAGPIPMTVAHVDLVGSTAHLTATDHVELERLVDALFEAGQHATHGSCARAIKYVGDGVFIAGASTIDVAVAASSTIDRLEASLPLAARGGLARGPVSRRAGDIFGLPVNHAQLLAKRARPGSLLAEPVAAAHLPPHLCGTARRLKLHRNLERAQAVEIVAPPAPLSGAPAA